MLQFWKVIRLVDILPEKSNHMVFLKGEDLKRIEKGLFTG